MIVSLTSFLLVAFSVGFFGLLAYVSGKWFFAVDQEVIKIRRAAAVVAANLKEQGWPEEITSALIDVSVNDLASMGEKLHDLAILFEKGDKAIMSKLSVIADRVLDAKLKTPEGRALLAAKLQDVAQATDPSITKAIAATVAKAAMIAA